MCSGLSHQVETLHGDATASREGLAAAAAMLSGGLWAEPRFWATVLLVQRTLCAFVTFLLFMALAAISHLALCSRCCTDWMSRFMRLGALCRACVTDAAACNKLVEASHEMLAGTICMLGWGLHAVLSGFLQHASACDALLDDLTASVDGGGVCGAAAAAVFLCWCLNVNAAVRCMPVARTTHTGALTLLALLSF